MGGTDSDSNTRHRGLWRGRWRWVALLFLVDLIVLGVTGTYLMFRYRPTAAQAWPTVHNTVRVPGKPWLLGASETLHRVSAFAALILAVLLVAWVIAARWRSSWARRTGVVVAGGVLIGALIVGIARGSRLRWDQLALWAVTTGTNLGGVWLPNSTKFVLVGRTEVSPGDFRTAVWVHVAVVPAIVVGAFVVILLASRRPSNSPSSEGDLSAQQVAERVGS